MRRPHVVLAYKNFPVAHHVSHIGLGVSALNTAKVLHQAGISADVWAILGAKAIADRIRTSNPRPTHIIIGAPWIPTLDLQNLVFSHPGIQFGVVCHSNVGFLQADPVAIKNFREALDLEQGAMNFTAAGNSTRFASWITASYDRPCAWLPNLYFLERTPPRQRAPWPGGCAARVGVFGALRPLKNHLSAAAACLEIANDLHIRIKFYINVGRIEGGNTVLRSLHAMLDDSQTVELHKVEWLHWPRFRHLIKTMDLLMQPSFTETFNMVTADGAAEGIPSVVSEAIDWAPKSWLADVDDPLDIARVGKQLLGNPRAGAEGYDALKRHNQAGLASWKDFLHETMPCDNVAGVVMP
jgi:hypothetical protein